MSASAVRTIQEAVLRCPDRNYFSKARLYEIVDMIRSHLDLTPESYPLNPFDIFGLQSQGLSIQFHSFESHQLGGLLVKNPWPQVSCMVINSARPALSQRFDCAHELMHFFLHPAGRGYVCETLQNRAHPYEYQANEGAAELLLPYRRFIPDLFSLGSSLADDRLTEELAERYGVSRAVVLYRVAGLSFEIHQYINGKALHELRILSRAKQRRESGFEEENAAEILTGILRKISLLSKGAPASDALRFDCAEYEKELTIHGFYESYYRGY